MKEYWIKLKSWHGQLERRERRAVNIGGFALIAIIFYVGIWSPFLGRVDHMRTHMSGEQKTLAWMKSVDQRITQLSGSNGRVRQNLTPVAMLSLLQDRVRRAGMGDALSEMKQVTNDSIQLRFKAVSFDRLIKLLISVIKDNHVTITQFSAAAQTTPGLVNADFTLGLN
tara:strand:- start:135 stop:641 length:507 start_codon:yes stop_codon:yes gene_type:complete